MAAPAFSTPATIRRSRRSMPSTRCRSRARCCSTAPMARTTRRSPSGRRRSRPISRATCCCRRRPTAAGRTSRCILYRAGKTIHFDDATRAAVRDLTGIARDYLRDGVEADLAQLAEAALPPGEPTGATFATPADGSGGATAKLVEQWENTAAAGDRVHRLHPARHARRSPGEMRPRQIPALERASAALRQYRAGARDRRGDRDPRVLRPQIPAGAASRAQAGQCDDG